ncbi:GNAT family protein [Longimicrobium sp.]|uniref:GNAT family N-acetyltransferase n=1 Tax=Longimicrobium sp. TaxID=2029185 RepID=UPI002CD4F139|nr:GNAT family protein [Longimicrobium sp.]HSU14469.1 GNAT family protein [Longimicrobium sp.]
MLISPITLEGRHVRLVPLTIEHVPALWAVADDDDIWRWTLSHPRSEEDMRRYVQAALDAEEEGAALPFATLDAASGRVIGSTRYHNVEPRHRRVEIGYTWLARPWQRTPANTEAKYLMLRHAFESLGCVRVELRTDALNERSRNAIARIGGVQEGILRRHMATDDGRFRDTVYYSILDDEWPGVKQRLEARLARPWTPAAP